MIVNDKVKLEKIEVKSADYNDLDVMISFRKHPSYVVESRKDESSNWKVVDNAWSIGIDYRAIKIKQ